MVRRDINEANIVRQGLASAALEDGATVGQVPAVGADGEIAFVDQSGGTGGSTPAILGVTTVLTDAQIKTLPTARVEVAPAPGVGKVIYGLNGGAFGAALAMRFHDASSGYTGVDSGVKLEFGLVFGEIVPGGVDTQFQDTDYLLNSGTPFLFSATEYEGDVLAFVCPPYDISSPATVAALSLCENKPLLFGTPNPIQGGSNFGGGHPDNSLVVAVYYAILDLP